MTEARFNIDNNNQPQSWQVQEYFSLYRLALAVAFMGLFLPPWPQDLFNLRNLLLTQLASLSYAAIAVTLLTSARRRKSSLNLQVYAGLMSDLLISLILLLQFNEIHTGVGALLIVPCVVAAILLRMQLALFFSAMSFLVLLLATLIHPQGFNGSNLIATGFLGAAYFGVSLFSAYLFARAKISEALAEQRGVDLANQEQLNALILQRMRTGILVVDDEMNIRQINEAAWYLLGMPEKRRKKLFSVSQELTQRLRNWQKTGNHDTSSMRLHGGVPECIPRFANIGKEKSCATLIFLEDRSMVSRRAEEMTLASLGRMAGSIAHEIRNPLSAVRHATQLLAESPVQTHEEHKLLEIILNHTDRMNRIIENVLQVSRRQASRYEIVDLANFLQHYQHQFSQSSLAEESVKLDIQIQEKTLPVIFDPSQLRQILDNLAQNAIRYGRSEDGVCYLSITAARDSEHQGPNLSLSDNGKGISNKEQMEIFQPFYSSSPQGSGLGLFIVRQLCDANQSVIEYRDNPEGGSMFVIAMQSPRQDELKDFQQGQEPVGYPA